MLTTQRVEIREEESAQNATSEDKATANNESTTNNQVEGVEEGDIVVVKMALFTLQKIRALLL